MGRQQGLFFALLTSYNEFHTAVDNDNDDDDDDNNNNNNNNNTWCV
jgi:hypothetical protein